MGCTCICFIFYFFLAGGDESTCKESNKDICGTDSTICDRDYFSKVTEYANGWYFLFNHFLLLTWQCSWTLWGITRFTVGLKLQSFWEIWRYNRSVHAKGGFILYVHLWIWAKYTSWLYIRNIKMAMLSFVDAWLWINKCPWFPSGWDIKIFSIVMSFRITALKHIVELGLSHLLVQVRPPMSLLVILLNIQAMYTRCRNVCESMYEYVQYFSLLCSVLFFFWFRHLDFYSTHFTYLKIQGVLC